MKRTRWFLISLVLAGIAVSQARAEPASVLLEKGIYAEETKGDVNEAITIYQKIVAETEANRPSVAEAYCRLGICYLKKGDKTKAAETFKTLLSRFPEQTRVVTQAGKELAKLEPTGPVPVVLSTSPPALTNDVSPSLTQITVTFDRPMMDKSWSWTGGGETFPETVGNPQYDSTKMTCTLTVKLQAGKVYWVGINSPSHNNFQTTGHVPAKRYVILFATKDKEGKPTAIPQQMLEQAKAINAETQKEISPEDKLECEQLIAKARLVAQSQARFAEAETLFKQAVAKDPTNANAWNGLGWSQFNQGMALNAKVAFEKCLAIEPTHAAALNGLGWIAKGQGKTDEAIKNWEKSVQADPTATVALNGLASTYMEQKNYNMAVKYYQMSLNVNPRDAQVKAGLEKAKAEGGVYVEPGPLTTQHVEPLTLNPAPWTDGEAIRLNLKMMTGMEIGTLIWSADSVKVNDKDAWRIEQRLFVTVNNSQEYTRVDAEKDSFAPMFGRTVNELGDFQANYLPNTVRLKVKSTGPETIRDIPLDRIAYDNEEALYLIRRLPLAKGYQARFPIFPVQGGAVVECRIDVTGKEKLTIRAGTFDCYAVTLSVWSGEVKALEHKLWLSCDKHRYVVKYDSGSAIMELVDVSQKQEDELAIYHDDELGIAVTAPAGWYFYKNPSPGVYKMLLQMLPPELNSWALLSVGVLPGGETSARKVAGGDIDILKGYFKNYTVRPESWADLTVAGMPAAGYAADYEDKGKAMVEYRTYILGESMVYWFVFRIEKDLFEANKPGFDSIVRSFTLTGTTTKSAKTD